MPMYFFSLRDREQVDDLDGTDLPGIDAARSHAHTVAKELMFKSKEKEWSHFTMSVSDEVGREVYSFVLSDFGHS